MYFVKHVHKDITLFLVRIYCSNQPNIILSQYKLLRTELEFTELAPRPIHADICDVCLFVCLSVQLQKQISSGPQDFGWKDALLKWTRYAKRCDHGENVRYHLVVAPIKYLQNFTIFFMETVLAAILRLDIMQSLRFTYFFVGNFFTKNFFVWKLRRLL